MATATTRATWVPPTPTCGTARSRVTSPCRAWRGRDQLFDSYEFTALPEYVTVGSVEPSVGDLDDKRSDVTLAEPLSTSTSRWAWRCRA